MTVITVGGTLIGPRGRAPDWSSLREAAPTLQHVDGQIFGADAIQVLAPLLTD